MKRDGIELTTITVRLPEEFIRRVKATAALRGIKIQDIVEEALKREIAREQEAA